MCSAGQTIRGRRSAAADASVSVIPSARFDGRGDTDAPLGPKLLGSLVLIFPHMYGLPVGGPVLAMYVVFSQRLQEHPGIVRPPAQSSSSEPPSPMPLTFSGSGSSGGSTATSA